MRIDNSASPGDEITLNANEFWVSKFFNWCSAEGRSQQNTIDKFGCGNELFFSSKQILNGSYDQVRLILRDEKPAQYKAAGSNQTYELALPFIVIIAMAGVLKGRFVSNLTPTMCRLSLTWVLYPSKSVVHLAKTFSLLSMLTSKSFLTKN